MKTELKTITNAEFSALCDRVGEAHTALSGCPRDRHLYLMETLSKVRDKLSSAPQVGIDTALLKRRSDLIAEVDESLHALFIAETVARENVISAEGDKISDVLVEVRAEISRLNKVHGKTIFNPTITQMVDSVMKDLAR